MIWNSTKQFNNPFRKDLRYLNESGQTIDKLDLNVCQIVPVIPCIGAKIKRVKFSGTVTEVFIDYTSDISGFDGDAVVIMVKVDEIQQKD